MKKITLKQAHSILDNAHGVIIDNDVILFPSLFDLKNDDLNEFLSFRWDDGGLAYDLGFLEGDNQQVEIVGSSMFLYDTKSEGRDDHIQITILVNKDIESCENFKTK